MVLDVLWYWTYFGNRRTLVLDVLWYWTYFGIGRTLVLGVLWYWAYFGVGRTLVLGVLLVLDICVVFRLNWFLHGYANSLWNI